MLSKWKTRLETALAENGISEQRLKRELPKAAETQTQKVSAAFGSNQASNVAENSTARNFAATVKPELPKDAESRGKEVLAVFGSSSLRDSAENLEQNESPPRGSNWNGQTFAQAKAAIIARLDAMTERERATMIDRLNHCSTNESNRILSELILERKD